MNGNTNEAQEAVQPIPAGFHSVTPYFTVDGGAAFIDFVSAAFNGREMSRSLRPDGSIAHAYMRVGDSMIEVSDARPEFPATRMAIHLYVPNVDQVYEQAVRSGAVAHMPPTDQLYGDRDSYVQDPFGNNWYIATHIESVGEEEIERRYAELYRKENERGGTD